MGRLIYLVAYRFFGLMTTSLNKTEVDQPPPLNDQQKRLSEDLATVTKAIAIREKQLEEIRQKRLSDQSV